MKKIILLVIIFVAIFVANNMFTKKTDTLNTANNNTADQSSDGGVTVE
jgi:uncharacterized protein YpmB